MISFLPNCNLLAWSRIAYNFCLYGSMNFSCNHWFRNSRSQMFFKRGVLKNFEIFTGKHPTKVFSCDYCQIFKNSFLFRTPAVATSDCSPLSIPATKVDLLGDCLATENFCKKGAFLNRLDVLLRMW